MKKLLAACALLLAGACARTDVGAPCHLQDTAGAELQPQPGREYLYLGSSECGSFTCLAVPGAGAPFCSQACAGPGASCPSGLVCATLSLDQEYLDAMKARLSPEKYQQLFGQVNATSWCVKAQ